MSIFKSPSDLCDVVSVAVLCEPDNTMMLTVESFEHWIPYVKIQPGQAWERAISKEVQEIFGVSIIDSVLKISKLWIPRHSQSFLLHVIFQGVVDVASRNKSKNVIGKYRGKLRWVTEADLMKLSGNNCLKSPEVLEIYYLLKRHPIPNYIVAEEFISLVNFVEVTDEIFVTGKGNLFSQLVDASGIDKLAQESLLKEFIFLCFPAVYMNLRAFTGVMGDFGWTKDQIQCLFNAADLNNRCGISFREYLYLVAACDPNTSHGGAAAEVRCRYMFRYYDKDRDNILKTEEFKNLLTDLRRSKKLPYDSANVIKEATETYKSMGVSDGAPLNVMEFLKAVCDLKIRGTSTLFRSNVSVIKHMRDIGDKYNKTSLIQLPQGQNKMEKNTRGKMTALSIRQFDYEVAVHTVKIQRSGQAINIDEMRQIQEAVSSTTLKQPLNEQIRRISMDLFSQRSVSNEVLKGVRYLTSFNKIKEQKANYTWGQLDSQAFGRNLINVCNQVREVLRCEPRLMELYSPVYIMGDFHGNVSDLLYFERVLWHIGPCLSPSNLLFLGDYVDRGAYSMEVISYLFSYKLQGPTKVTLLRGNHEIRDIQKMFTFHKECVLKLGDKLGNEVWNAVNSAFDTMPLAAVIDGKIFCCHGGVPPPWLCPNVSAINDIPVPLNQPDVQSSLAWELMWNDPVRPKTVNEKLAMELLANEGFAFNSRRGTAHIFSVEALERFLKANKFTHLVRAHEVVQAGFQVQQKGKLLTVFSSSKYCGGQNDAACLLADQGKLRILRLETE